MIQMKMALWMTWDKPGGHDGIVWVRMTRVGDVLTAYYSNVGPESWTEMASHNVGFGGQEMQICACLC